MKTQDLIDQFVESTKESLSIGPNRRKVLVNGINGLISKYEANFTPTDKLLGLLDELVDASKGERAGDYVGCIEAAKAAVCVEQALRELNIGYNPDAKDIGCDSCNRKVSYATTLRNDEVSICVVCAAETREEYGCL